MMWWDMQSHRRIKTWKLEDPLIDTAFFENEDHSYTILALSANSKLLITQMKRIDSDEMDLCEDLSDAEGTHSPHIY